MTRIPTITRTAAATGTRTTGQCQGGGISIPASSAPTVGALNHEVIDASGVMAAANRSVSSTVRPSPSPATAAV